MFASVIADGILFSLLYCTLYDLRFGVWPAFSLRMLALLTIWSLSSYVVGRYVSGAQREIESQTWYFVSKQLIGTAIVLLLTLGANLLHTWIFNQNTVQALYRSFLIPFLGSIAVLARLFSYYFLD